MRMPMLVFTCMIMFAFIRVFATTCLLMFVCMRVCVFMLTCMPAFTRM